MADPVGQGSLPFLYNDFHGGLNTKNSPYLLTDDEARDLSNVQGTTAGAIVKRTGLVTFANPPQVTLTSLAPAEALSPTFLIGAGGTSLYSISTGGAVTAIATGLTSGLRWEAICGPQDTTGATQGPVYMLNGTDTPQQWTGTGNTSSWTATDGGAVPNGKYLIYANNQVFVTGVAAFPSRVYWSGLGAPCQWNVANLTGAGFMDFDPNDGEAISGIGRVGPYVLVAKPRKLWILVDPATATARRLSDNVGCIAHRSIATGPEGTYFLAEDRGVYVTNGTKLTPISDKIQPTIDTISPSLRSQAAGTYINGHYYLSVSLNGGTNDTTLDFDAVLTSWWKHTIGSNQWAIWHPGGSAQLYSAKATAAIVDEAFVPGVYTDNGAAMTWRWAGPWQSPTFYRRRRFPTPYFRKRLRQIRIDGAGTVDFSLARDFAVMETLVKSNVFGVASGTDNWGATGTYGDTTTFGGQPSISRTKIFGQGVANAFSFVFSGTSTTADQVTSYVMMMTDRRDLVAS